MANRFEDAGRQASEQTNQELSTELCEATGLGADRLESLFPKIADKEDLREMISILKTATDHNTQVANLKDRFDKCGHVAITLLKEFLKI